MNMKGWHMGLARLRRFKGVLGVVAIIRFLYYERIFTLEGSHAALPAGDGLIIELSFVHFSVSFIMY